MMLKTKKKKGKTRVKKKKKGKTRVKLLTTTVSVIWSKKNDAAKLQKLCFLFNLGKLLVMLNASSICGSGHANASY